MILFELFQYDFMVRAMVAGAVVAVIAPTIGIFLVVRRYAFLADTLAHVSLAGVGIGFLAGTHPVLTAIVIATLAGLLVERMRASGKASGDASLAMFLFGSLALASVLLSQARGPSAQLSSLLFGSIVTVTPTDLRIILGFGIIVLLTIAFLRQKLFSVSYDEEWALSSGAPVTLLNAILVLIAAVTVALSMRIVGLLLIGALMVIPVLAAMQFRRGFFATLMLAILLSLFCVASGIVASYAWGWPSGGTIVLIAIGTFLLSALPRRSS